jgi:outer membrane protein W
MKMHKWWVVAVMLLGLASLPEARAVEGHVMVGVTYASGLPGVSDAVVDYYGVDLDTLNIPVGLQLGVNVELMKNDTLALAPELRLGPAMFVLVQETGGTIGDTSLFVLPLSLSARCTFLPNSKISPYVRLGVSYVALIGDLADDSTPGFEGAIGVEFFRNGIFGFGLEAGWNSCEVKIGGQDVQPVDFFAGIYATFKFGGK